MDDTINTEPILNWAENEIEMAIESEKKTSDDPEDYKYGVACYESAMRAFKSILEDDPSYASIHIIKGILNRLIDGKCLTPIEDTDDIWEEITWAETTTKEYQCKRLSSLFKKVTEKGEVTYSDIYRVQCANINNPDLVYQNGFATRLIDKIFPIETPYLPASKPFKLFREDFLVDPKKGMDYDTFAYLYILMPNGYKVELNRYFKEDDNGQVVPIEKEEYDKRKAEAKKEKKK